MKRSIPFLFLFQGLFLIVSGQDTAIHYGNNPAAGKYYSIRGFRMYCENYGQGQPLLIIHGNGGSIADFANNIPYFSRKYKVIVADNRAQGKSSDPTDSLSYEMLPNSGHSTPIFYKDAFDANVDDFFSKPYRNIQKQARLQ